MAAPVVVLVISHHDLSLRQVLSLSGYSESFVDEWLDEIQRLLPWSKNPGHDALLDILAVMYYFS